MFKTITTVVATLAVAGIASADDAVQWTEAEGGNGHWYMAVDSPDGYEWNEAVALAESMGGYLVSITSEEEDSWVYGNVDGDGRWIGGWQDINDPDYSEPGGGWKWLTGEEWTYTNWNGSGPDNNDQSGPSEEYVAYCCGGNWNDIYPSSKNLIIEWSADCNDDGLVDYGQILDGSLADDNSNGVPDSCELDHIVPDHYPSIQAAIDQTDPGMVIQVRSGTYTENLLSNTPIILRSLDGPEKTIIDGNQSGTVIQLAGGQPHAIDGFTVTNGVGPANTAGGILISGGTHLTIRNCTISNNTHIDGDNGGGGLKINVGSLQMNNCVFDGNSSSWNGAAVYIWHSCCVYITDCTFRNQGHDGTEYGPLDIVHMQNDSTATITGCVFDGNRFRDSEVVVWVGGLTTVTDCDFLNGEQTEPTQQPEAGSVFSGQAGDLAIGSNYACGHPEPHVTIEFTDLGGNEFTDEPCDPINDCNLNGIEDAEDIAKGTSLDCNGNAIPDECDLANGTSIDCNGNSIPDECESLADCNGNNIPDECETLADCDSDGTPDICEILDGAIDANPADGIPDECQGLPVGACCVNSLCSALTAAQCFALEGNYAGVGISCADANCPTACAGDVNGDNQVGIIDLLTIIDGWGFCP